MHKRCKEILSRLESEKKIKVWWDFKFPQIFDNGARLKNLLEDEVDEKYYIKNNRANSLINQLYETGQLDNERICSDSTINSPKTREISNCITARYDAGIQNQKQIGLVVVEPCKVQQLGNIVDTGSWSNPQAGRVYSINGCSPTLNTMQGGGRQPKIVEGEVGYEKHSEFRIRKLTPKECFRLMGFTDKDFYKAKDVGISNSQLYKQAGNSIVVDVLFYIMLELHNQVPDLMEDIKLGSFFSGLGAFESALERLCEYINKGEKNKVLNMVSETVNLTQPLII